MAEPLAVSGVDAVLECVDLDANVRFCTERLGARILSISPADDPAEFVLGIAENRVRVRRAPHDLGGRLVVRADRAPDDSTPLVAPNGTVIEFVLATGVTTVPESVPSLSVVHASAEFGVGRAEMHYRDLVPDRWGGRFIASHIRIPDGGDVADYVHFHRIRFQMIFVVAGWVELVYQDQGPPFRLEAGDCVTQPPEIRHRVLRSSPGLEVIEIGCPAVHDTFVEHEIDLPTAHVDAERDFDGQRFVRHTAATTDRLDYLVDGLRARDTGIDRGTDGLAGAVVVEVDPAVPAPADPATLTYDGEFLLHVVLRGDASVTIDAGDGDQLHVVGSRDAIALPPGARWRWSGWSPDFEVLQVTLPADPVRRLPLPLPVSKR